MIAIPSPLDITRARELLTRPVALVSAAALMTVIALGLVAVDAVRDMNAAERAISREREVQRTINEFESRAWAAESISLESFATGGDLPVAALVSFIALTSEMEAFFIAEREAADPGVRRLARQNLGNVEESREAVARLRDLAGSLRSDAQLLRGNIDVSTRFFGGLDDRVDYSQARVDALFAARERAENRGLAVAATLLVLLGGLAAIALMRLMQVGRLRERTLSHLALTDPLTGLANRRGLDEHLAATTDDATLSVVVLDLDDFKAVNDRLGHPAGDAVLAATGERLRAAIQDGEFGGRYGGDEFVLVLPLGESCARARSGDILATVFADPFPGAGELTASAGIATRREGEGLERLLERADDALYAAKRGPDRERHSAGRSWGSEPREQALRALNRLAARLDARLPGGIGHSERVASLARRLAIAAGWTPRNAERLAETARLHDIGKVALPDTLIVKAGPLSEAERAQLHRHPSTGARMAAEVLDDEQLAWLTHHRERWTGGGYPDGLAGEDIPEGALLLGVAEAWDAMRSTRAHSDALDTDDALAECRRASGTQLWPVGVALLESIVEAGARPPAPIP